MKIKPFHIIILALIPIILVSYSPMRRKIEQRRAAEHLKTTVNNWSALKFSPITNAMQRTEVATQIIQKLKGARLDDEACSEEVLSVTLVRLLKAFSASDEFNFKEMSGKPDVDNYRKFRGFDLAGSIETHWGPQELPGRREGRKKVTPQEVGKLRTLLPGTESIPKSSRGETGETTHLLVWLYSIFDRPETNQISSPDNPLPQAVCCNGHWTGINLTELTLCLTNTLPEVVLMRQPNCGVGNEKSNFSVDFPDGPELQLLLSATVQLDCGIEAHPVAISLRWHPTARRWIPTAFAAGSTIDNIRYLW